jgi:hypothetical protein
VLLPIRASCEAGVLATGPLKSVAATLDAAAAVRPRPPQNDAYTTVFSDGSERVGWRDRRLRRRSTDVHAAAAALRRLRRPAGVQRGRGASLLPRWRLPGP